MPDPQPVPTLTHLTDLALTRLPAITGRAESIAGAAVEDMVRVRRGKVGGGRGRCAVKCDGETAALKGGGEREQRGYQNPKRKRDRL